MNLELTAVGTKSRLSVSARGDSFLRMKDGHFAMVVPHFDDWMQTQEYDLGAAGTTVSIENSAMAIHFQTDDARIKFAKWIEETNEKAELGYRTMYP